MNHGLSPLLFHKEREKSKADKYGGFYFNPFWIVLGLLSLIYGFTPAAI